jgi:hypothetical protein
MTDKKECINFYIDEEKAQLLKERAATGQRSLSSLVRLIIDEWLAANPLS